MGLDLPGIRSADAILAGAHGSLPGQDRLESRTVEFKLTVQGLDEDTFWATLQSMSLAFAPTDVELPLTFKVGSLPPMRINCRLRRKNIPIKQRHEFQYIDATMQLFASDPIIYSEALESSSADAPTVPQGKDFSAAYAWDFGVPGTGGVVDVFNVGTAPAPWIARIFGPCINPSIIGPGGQLTWESELQAGEFLELNAHPSLQTVLVGGVSSQFGQLSDTSTWFLLPVGSSNVVLNTGDGNGSVLFSYRSAWYSVT